MCFFPAGSAEAENTSSFTSAVRIKRKIWNINTTFSAFKGRARGEFVNNKPKLAPALISMELPGESGAEEGAPRGFCPLVGK